MATVALSEPGGWWGADRVHAAAHRVAAAAGTATGAESSGADSDRSEYRLSGIKNHVLWAERADLVIAPFVASTGDGGGELSLFAIEPKDLGAALTVAAERAVDTTRRAARLTMTDTAVPARCRLSGNAASGAGDGAWALAAWRAVHVRGYMLLAAEAVGAAAAIHDQTCAYARDRVQFDRPIGSFQAVKHPLVDVLSAIEQARTLVYSAAATLDALAAASAGQPDGAGEARAEVAARMAKAAATSALRMAADRGVQLHGGFGFTWDCDAHLFVKRALWTAATLGDELHHRRHLARSLLDPERRIQPA
ncbi:MAG: acyl-CoA dehydrogenase family protein [Myxococcota bacterium]